MEIDFIIQKLEEIFDKKSSLIKAENKKIPINPEFFYGIKDEESEIAFIDGGNAELIESPSLSLQIMKIAVILYMGKKRLSRDIKEYWILTEARDGFFVCSDIKSGEKMEISEDEPSLASKANKVSISQAANLFRKHLELKKILELKTEIIVRDGDLFPKQVGDQEIIDKIKLKSNLIAGLSKSSSILTDAGQTAVEVLNKNGPPSSWIYLDESQPDISFVKLASNSKHVFRLDVVNATPERSFSVASALLCHCSDPVFPGYPYGLIEADKFARVTNREKEFYKTIIFSKAPMLESQRNSHSILDSIS